MTVFQTLWKPTKYPQKLIDNEKIRNNNELTNKFTNFTNICNELVALKNLQSPNVVWMQHWLYIYYLQSLVKDTLTFLNDLFW